MLATPISSARRSASQSRRWIFPPRGYSPAPIPPSRSRAPAAVTSMRPGGDTSSSQPAITHHHERVGSQVTPSIPAATLFPAAVQVTQRRPLSVLNANVAQHLPDLGLQRYGSNPPVPRARGGCHQVEGRRQVADRGVLVDVGHRDLGKTLPQTRHQLGGGETATSVVEEVGRRLGDHGPEDLRPQLLHPAGRPRQAGCRGTGRSRLDRPGQRIAVDLSGGLRRKGLDDRETRDHRRRHPGAELVHCRLVVERAGDGDVADEQLDAAAAASYGGRRCRDPRQVQEGVVDLTELDASAAELDLLVGPPDEDQSLLVVPDDVATAVGARPPERRHRGELLGVLVRVQVAGQADPADDQLTVCSRFDVPALRVDHGKVPAVQGKADPDRTLTRELCPAADDRGLRGAVGVPHLPVGSGKPDPDVGRTCLATEDQQPDARKCLCRPESHQCRHGRDHGDVVGDQPRAEVHPGTHQ